MGKQKASVFPDPVKAIPIMSRPANLGPVSARRGEERQALNDIRRRQPLQLNRSRICNALALHVLQ